jgi:adenylate kinase
MGYEFDTDQISIIQNWLQAGSINIFGRPFAGKDTQGNILADMFGGPLLGGGEILRNSVIPPRSKAAIKKGLLVPTEEYVEIVLPYLSQETFKGKPLFLSSVGRWHGEEDSVITATDKAGHPLKLVIYLDLSPDQVRQRWQKAHQTRSLGERGDRADDTAEILEVRLKEFQDKTIPVIEHYEQNTSLLKRIDASQPAVEVTAQILQELLRRAQSS